MNREYDAIVVGGGLAGLTSAAYLCKYGVKTLLVEKGEKTGGLVNTFWHQGFAFDAGIRAFENSGILFPMLKSLGINMEFNENPVSIGIQNEWVNLDSRDSLQSYAYMLTTLFPNNARDIARIADEIEKVMGYMDVLYGIDNPLFLENVQDLQYLMKTLLPWLLRYQVNIRKAGRLNEPVYSYLKHFTDNAALTDMIAQHFFRNTPTFFALSYFGLYLDYQLLPNLAIHEAVLAELVDERPHQFAQALIESGIPPQLKLLRDSDLNPIEQAMRQTMELQIAPFTNFDPSRNNKDDRGEVKTLAHMAVKGYTFFVTNDANALRLIERADQLGTSLDALKTLHFYEDIYLLFRNGAMQLADAKNLYRYLYYMTKRERDGNPAWGDFCGGMDKLYASIS